MRMPGCIGPFTTYIHKNERVLTENVAITQQQQKAKISPLSDKDCHTLSIDR